MTSKEEIIKVLRAKGPLVPNEIKRTIGTGGDTFIFGAILSELSGRGLVKISSLKKGGSPLYFLPGQEKMLEHFIEYHNPKDQQTIHLLKEKKVLRDRSLELFERVSLRQIKDFAKQFKVKSSQGEELFWRYYLVPAEEAFALLQKKARPQKSSSQIPPQPKSKQSQPKARIITADEPLQTVSKNLNTQPKVPETQKTFKEPESSSPPTPNKASKELVKTPFLTLLENYFSQAGIKVLSQEQISKEREYEFDLIIPSAVGAMKMYCRARNKKKLNEGDVAPALLKAKMKDLPCFFLTTGDFTKKALALIKEQYRGLTIKKLE